MSVRGLDGVFGDKPLPIPKGRSTVKRLFLLALLSGFLMSVAIGCESKPTTGGTAPKADEKKADEKKAP
jgi:hypothetical protein